MVRLDQGLHALHEANDIAVVASQPDILTIVHHTDDVDRSDGPRFRTNVVEKGYDFLLVGNRDVESF